MRGSPGITTASDAALAAPAAGRRLGPRGGRAHCLDLGPRTAPVALLIHGLGGLAQEIAAPLSGHLLDAGYRVLAVDRPGYGYSDPCPADAMGPAAQGRWLLAVLDRLGVRPAVVVAHSFGAAVALWLARSLAPRPAGLVLVNPFCRPTPPASAPLLRLSVAPGLGAVVRRRIAPVLSRRVVDWCLSNAFAPDPTPAALRALPTELMTQESALLAMVAELRGFNADAARLPAERMGLGPPIVALTGVHDRVVAGMAHGEWLADNFPRVEHWRAEAGHMLHHTRPELVAEAVRRVARLNAPRRSPRRSCRGSRGRRARLGP